MEAELYNLKNEKVGMLEVPHSVFGVPWNAPLVAQVFAALSANARRPWAHVKTRGEVRGGGRKPWRQKGTGRARHGSRRSPLWIGGGKAHGPRNERDYTQKINKKMKRLATLSALSKKFTDREIMFFDTLEVTEPKTKKVWEAAKNILQLPRRSKTLNVLFVPAPKNKNLYRAARNLVKTKVVAPTNLSVSDLLIYKRIFMDKNAVDVLKTAAGAKK